MLDTSFKDKGGDKPVHTGIGQLALWSSNCDVRIQVGKTLWTANIHQLLWTLFCGNQSTGDSNVSGGIK